jgi:hypothetical protein
MKADFQCRMEDLPEEFLIKYQGSLKYVVFEFVGSLAWETETLTGHSKCLDIAYDLLAFDGTCIVSSGSSGGKWRHHKTLLAQISGFKYGLCLPVQVEPYVALCLKKDPSPVIIHKIKDLVEDISWDMMDLNDVHSLEVQDINSLQPIEQEATTPPAIVFSYINFNGQKMIRRAQCIEMHSNWESVTPLDPKEHPTSLIIKDHFSRLNLNCI